MKGKEEEGKKWKHVSPQCPTSFVEYDLKFMKMLQNRLGYDFFYLYVEVTGNKMLLTFKCPPMSQYIGCINIVKFVWVALKQSFVVVRKHQDAINY